MKRRIRIHDAHVRAARPPHCRFLCCLWLALCLWEPVLISAPASTAAGAENPRLRLIIESDAGGDPDDEQSLVRFLLYANEWDIEGIIANRPQARAGENRNPARTGLGIVRRLLTAYGQCYSNLVQHDPQFPSLDHLWSRTVPGYDDQNEGVNLILAAAERADPRPIWYSDWGTDHGAATNNLRRALDIARARGEAAYAKFKNRWRLSSADAFGPHTSDLEPPFRLWVDTFSPELEGKRWYHRFSALTTSVAGFDLVRDVLLGHGPLGAIYPTNTTHWGKEGDSMTFLYLVPTGMNDPDQPTWGGWAGRYGLNEQFPGRNYYWANQSDSWRGTTHREHTLARWAQDLQNDFCARLDWCVKPFDQANHSPRAWVNGNGGRAVLEVPVIPGSAVRLSAAGSTDPDGNALTYAWFQYAEPGTFQGELPLERIRADEISVRVPPETQGRTIHVMLTVRDDGHPPLATYRRIILQPTRPR